MKKEKQQMIQEEEQQNYTFLQKVLYLFIFPVLFLITVVLAILTIQGTNVFDLAQTFIPKETAKNEEPGDNGKEVLPSIEDESKPETNQEVIMLEREINDKEREITKLVAELEQANKRIRDLEAQEQEIKSSTKELAALYERMSTKKAAGIIMELEEEMALLILRDLSVSKKSGILGQLEPDQAARFTKLLAENE
jgi:flagellar motility protein MotE (MotC chaperone)